MIKHSTKYKLETRLLIDKLLLLSKDKNAIDSLFYDTNTSKKKTSYDWIIFIKGYGYEFFDEVPYHISEKEKQELDDFFKSQGILEKDNGSIFNLHDKQSEKQAFMYRKTFRILAKGSYQFLKTFPSLRDKFYDLYHDRPHNLYARCQSFAHFKLLKNTMGIEPTDTCLIYTLNNFLENNKLKPFYLKEGIPYNSSALKKYDKKLQTEENKRLILEWATNNILILNNQQLTQSTISLLLNNGYSEKSLLEKGFPKISWDEEILIPRNSQAKIVSNKIFIGNHFFNSVSNKNYQLLNSKYIMKENDFRLIPQLEQSEYSTTTAQKEKIKKIINNSLFLIDGTPGNKIPYFIFKTSTILKKDTDKLTSTDFIFCDIESKTSDKYLNIFQEKGINIYETYEENGIKSSLFCNAFLSQENILHSSSNSDLELMEYFIKAPKDNKDIIIEFFEKNVSKLINLASLKTSKTYEYHFPFLSFISQLQDDITEKLIDNTLNSIKLPENHQKIFQESSSTSGGINNKTVIKAIDTIEIYKRRFITNNIFTSEQNDNNNDDREDRAFKL